MAWFRVLAFFSLLLTVPLASRAYADFAVSAQNPVRETAVSRDGLRLALKHFSHPGDQNVLLIHGLAQNDRGWDSSIQRYSFARFLHAQGFDVWVGNMRGAGTAGFRSDTPNGPHHWTVEDYSINDIPALVDAVHAGTGQAPFVIGHSLAAWALEGYLAGLAYDSSGRASPQFQAGLARQHKIRGVITIAGVYNLRWEHSLSDASRSPVQSAGDYYHSNYELELLAGIKPLYHVVPNLPSLPLGWINSILALPFDRIPYIGESLAALYQGLQLDIISTPVFSMFYYPPDSDAMMVREHAVDGLEDMGPHLVEQLANAVNDHRTSSYYHLDRPADAYDYSRVRSHAELPMLFVAGGRDRLASALEIYQDGYLSTQASDKQFLHVADFGHLDILSGIRAQAEVMVPVVNWMRARL